MRQTLSTTSQDVRLFSAVSHESTDIGPLRTVVDLALTTILDTIVSMAFSQPHVRLRASAHTVHAPAWLRGDELPAARSALAELVTLW